MSSVPPHTLPIATIAAASCATSSCAFTKKLLGSAMPTIPPIFTHALIDRDFNFHIQTYFSPTNKLSSRTITKIPLTYLRINFAAFGAEAPTGGHGGPSLRITPGCRFILLCTFIFPCSDMLEGISNSIELRFVVTSYEDKSSLFHSLTFSTLLRAILKKLKKWCHYIKQYNTWFILLLKNYFLENLNLLGIW